MSCSRTCRRLVRSRVVAYAAAALTVSLGASTADAQVSASQNPRPSASVSINSVAAIINEARESAPGSRLAAASAQLARKVAGLAATPLLPFVSLEASALRQTLNLAAFGFPGPSAASDPFSVYATGVRVQQALVDPAAWRRWRAQRDSARAPEGDAGAGRDGVAAFAAARYYQLLAADAARAARTADSTLAAAVLTELEARRRVGDVTDIDVTRARLGVLGASARVADARAAYEQARLDLALAIGRRVGGLPDITDTLRAPAVDDAAQVVAVEADIRASALGRRPDIVASRARREAAAGVAAARRLEYLPRISAFGEYQALGVTTGTLPAVYRVGVQASIPLIDGLSRVNRAGLDAERLRIAAALADEAMLRAGREIDGASVELRRALSGVAVADAQFALASEELEQARRRVRAGIGSTLETTQGIAGVAAARDQVIGGRLRYHLARLEWHRATGTLDALR